MKVILSKELESANAINKCGVSARTERQIETAIPVIKNKTCIVHQQVSI